MLSLCCFNVLRINYFLNQTEMKLIQTISGLIAAASIVMTTIANNYNLKEYTLGLFLVGLIPFLYASHKIGLKNDEQNEIK